MRRLRLRRQWGIAVLAAAWCGLALPTTANAATIVSSAGPLTSIDLGASLQCQVHYGADSHGEFFGGLPGACGTFLGIGGPVGSGGTVYGPADLPAGPGGVTPYVPVSQSSVTGAGSAADPFRVETTVDAGATGLRIRRTDSYVEGSDKYTSTATVSNAGSTAATIVLYHGADCYLGDSDIGYGHRDDATGGIFCTKSPDNDPPGRLEGFVPVDGASNHSESHYGSNWSLITSGLALPDMCACATYQDNGMAISWSTTVPAGGSVSRSWSTDFSPVGAIRVSSYAALGDSIAAGEGIGYGWHWDAGAKQWTGGHELGAWANDFQSVDCHQTLFAHPRLIASALGAQLTHFACTGAGTFNGVLRAKREDGTVVQPAQLGSATITNAEPPNGTYTDLKPDFVSLSLGANDVGFADIVARCYGVDFIGFAQCGLDPDEEDTYINLVFVAQHSVRRVLEEIVRRGQEVGSVPVVALTQYVDPFPERYPANNSCVDVNPRLGDTAAGTDFAGAPVGVQLSNYEMGYLRRGLKRLNDALADVAEEFPNVVLIPPPSGFGQHRWCSADPWVFGASIRAMDFPQHIDDRSPFHPTAAGQSALADQVVSRLGAGRHVGLGFRIPVSFPNSVSMIFDQVRVAGAAFFTPLGLLSASGARQVARAAAADGVTDDLPPADTFAPVELYSTGTSSEYTGGVDIRLPSLGATGLYQVVGDGWQQVTTTTEGDDLVAHLDSLRPLALGNPAPPVHAAFSLDGDDQVAPASVSVDASNSSIDSGSIAEYAWDFGDGETASGVTASHSYEISGTYEIRLRVTSDVGATQEAIQTVTVRNAAPLARLTAPGQMLVDTPGSFSADGSQDPNDQVAEVAWDFGDGTSLQTGSNLTHAYAQAGTYTVTMTVLDEEGASAQATAQVDVVATRSAPSLLPRAPGGGLGALPAPAKPSVRISSKLRRDKRGHVLVAVACKAGGARCTGTVAVLVGRKPTITLATGRVRLRAGERATLKLKLRAKILRGLRGKAIGATVRVRLADGSITTARCRMPLKRKRD